MKTNILYCNVPKIIFFIFFIFFLTACSASKKIEPQPASKPDTLTVSPMPSQVEPESLSVTTSSSAIDSTLLTQSPIPSIDPYEHHNRNAYRLNQKLDNIALKPMAKAYKKVVPEVARHSVTNFFSNLLEIPRFANDVLQARFYWAMNDLWRFLINTTAGVGGLFDVATKMGLPLHRNSFSATLDRWGAKPAPYVMLPVLGPGSLYVLYSFPVDFYLSPWVFIHAEGLSYGLFIVQTVDTRANFLQNEDLINQIAVDRYVFFRNAYLQAYQKQLFINNNPPDSSKKQDEEDDEVYEG
jgi:phospholipid-binding lipoprotein MlaA